MHVSVVYCVLCGRKRDNMGNLIHIAKVTNFETTFRAGVPVTILWNIFLFKIIKSKCD
jgi:hypothetical protein